MKKLAKTKKEVVVSKVVQVEVIEEQNWGNPTGFTSHPTQNLGQGRHQIVLHNDPMSAAHVVLQILQDVFNKDSMEADFIMKEAHYRGQSICFNASFDECQDYLAKIEQLKMQAITKGVPRIHIQNLTFSVDGMRNQLSPRMKLIA